VPTWKTDGRLAIGDLTFELLPPWSFSPNRKPTAGADFLVAKSRPLLDRYVELLDELRPRNIFELGSRDGGSTAFLCEAARPRRLVALDKRPIDSTPGLRSFREYVLRKGLDESVRVYGEVDQAARGRLAELVQETFGDEPLDLVVDDCSHLYEPSRASFNELFPRLRPGGLYVIEDWSWAHTELGHGHPDGLMPDQIPLTRLIFELQIAIPSVPGLISKITTEADWVEVSRGEADVDARGFDISACSNPRGRRLLGDERAGTVDAWHRGS
jgi:SAM-dependent methyltransferase